MDEEAALIRDLKRNKPCAPSKDLEARIFQVGTVNVKRELISLAALLFLCLGLTLAVLPVRSKTPSRAGVGRALFLKESPELLSKRMNRVYKYLGEIKEN